MTAALEPYGVSGTRTKWRRLLRRVPVREAATKAYFRKHETALDMQRKMGEAAFAGFRKFTVVRNPFDHAVSHYEYLKEFRNPKLAARFAAMSFAEYLQWRETKRGLFVPFFTILPDQAHFIADRAGTGLLVDRVLKFENLAEDFGSLCKELGLPEIAMARINPTRAKKAGRSLESYYDDDSLATVRRLYARDFPLLGYSTDLPRA